MSSDNPGAEREDRWRRFERSSDAYALVTGLLLLLIIIPILTSDFQLLEGAVTAILVGAAVTLAMAASRAHRWAIHLSWIAASLALIGGLTSSLDEVRIGAGVILAVLMISTPVVILRRIGVHEKVTATTVFGAIAAYLAFGIAFSLMYSAVVQGDPNSFTNLKDGGLGETNYFSFVTMTTLGYGDIAPTEDLPRALAVFQTLIGQIYLVVVVARVVSLLGKPNQPLRKSDEF